MYYKVKEIEESNSILTKSYFSKAILHVIENYIAIACTDILKKRYYMGAIWIISTDDDSEEDSDKIWSNQQTNNTIIAAEAIVVCNLIRTICENTKYSREGRVEVFCDCERVVLEINKGLMNDSMKATTELKDGLVLICEMIKLIKKMKVGIFVRHTEGHPKGKIIIKDNPRKFLIKKYNGISK